MHQGGFDLKNITKIEGHANLSVKVRGNVIKEVQFKVMEGYRFFERTAIGESYKYVPDRVARICGFCSMAHMSTAIEAIENAFNVEPSDQTALLRELLVQGQFLKSHSLHLLLLALPDYLGKSSVLEFNKRQHKFIHWALDLKKAGTDLLKVIGGRAYHTLRCRVGGFSKFPEQKDIDELLKQLNQVKKTAIDTVYLFDSLKDKLKFERKTNFIALTGSEYCFLCGKIISSEGICIPEKDFHKYLHEFVVPYSTSKIAKFKGKEFMVGALARMNLNWKEMHSEAKKLIKELKLKFPNYSPFNNNLAQAIELVHILNSAEETLKDLKIRKESIPFIKPRAAKGVGVTEAPRGTLYHEFEFLKNGTVKNLHILVPTTQNNHNIEEDIKEFLPVLLKKKLSREKISLELEKLIRAYDPCISCATHFLKVKWK